MWEPCSSVVGQRSDSSKGFVNGLRAPIQVDAASIGQQQAATLAGPRMPSTWEAQGFVCWVRFGSGIVTARGKTGRRRKLFGKQPGTVGCSRLRKVNPYVAAAVFVIGAGDGVGRPAERLSCGKGAVQRVESAVVDVERNVETQPCGTNKRHRNRFLAGEMGIKIVTGWGTMHLVVFVPSAGA
jgi:hypothetical protein